MQGLTLAAVRARRRCPAFGRSLLGMKQRKKVCPLSKHCEGAVMINIICPLVVALVVTFVQAGGRTVSADRNDAAEAEIKALELHLAKLLVSRDFDEYEKYLAADYTRINASGVVETREQVMAGFRASSRGGSMDPTELDVKVYGETAILTGKLSDTNSAGTRQSRFRKVFISRGRKWFLVSLQGVPLSGTQ
jgi:hypothetical protein